MASQNKELVEIFNQQYQIGSGSVDPDYIRRAADHLDHKMREIADRKHRQVPLEIAILAAMELADEVLQTRSHHAEVLSQVDAKISRFANWLGGSAGGGDQGEGDAGSTEPRF